MGVGASQEVSRFARDSREWSQRFEEETDPILAADASGKNHDRRSGILMDA